MAGEVVCNFSHSGHCRDCVVRNDQLSSHHPSTQTPGQICDGRHITTNCQHCQSVVSPRQPCVGTIDSSLRQPCVGTIESTPCRQPWIGGTTIESTAPCHQPRIGTVQSPPCRQPCVGTVEPPPCRQPFTGTIESTPCCQSCVQSCNQPSVCMQQASIPHSPCVHLPTGPTCIQSAAQSPTCISMQPSTTVQPPSICVTSPIQSPHCQPTHHPCVQPFTTTSPSVVNPVIPHQCVAPSTCCHSHPQTTQIQQFDIAQQQQQYQQQQPHIVSPVNLQNCPTCNHTTPQLNQPVDSSQVGQLSAQPIGHVGQTTAQSQSFLDHPLYQNSVIFSPSLNPTQLSSFISPQYQPLQSLPSQLLTSPQFSQSQVPTSEYLRSPPPSHSQIPNLTSPQFSRTQLPQLRSSLLTNSLSQLPIATSPPGQLPTLQESQSQSPDLSPQLPQPQLPNLLSQLPQSQIPSVPPTPSQLPLSQLPNSSSNLTSPQFPLFEPSPPQQEDISIQPILPLYPSPRLSARDFPNPYRALPNTRQYTNQYPPPPYTQPFTDSTAPFDPEYPPAPHSLQSRSTNIFDQQTTTTITEKSETAQTIIKQTETKSEIRVDPSAPDYNSQKSLSKAPLASPDSAEIPNVPISPKDIKMYPSTVHPAALTPYASVSQLSQQQNYPKPGTDGVTGLECLLNVDQLFIKQEVEFLEILTSFETQNKYKIINNMGIRLFSVAEESSCMARCFCGVSREFVLHVVNHYGQEVIRLSRDCKLCAHISCLGSWCGFELTVESPPGQIAGFVKQRSSWIYPYFHICDAQDNTILTITGPMCQCAICGDLEFEVKSGEYPVGVITKQWSGLLQEVFTDADNFGVTFPMDLALKMKAVMIGAAFLIDYMYFEKSRDNTNNTFS